MSTDFYFKENGEKINLEGNFGEYCNKFKEKLSSSNFKYLSFPIPMCPESEKNPKDFSNDKDFQNIMKNVVFLESNDSLSFFLKDGGSTIPFTPTFLQKEISIRDDVEPNEFCEDIQIARDDGKVKINSSDVSRIINPNKIDKYKFWGGGVRHCCHKVNSHTFQIAFESKIGNKIIKVKGMKKLKNPNFSFDFDSEVVVTFNSKTMKISLLAEGSVMNPKQKYYISPVKKIEKKRNEIHKKKAPLKKKLVSPTKKIQKLPNTQKKPENKNKKI